MLYLFASGPAPTTAAFAFLNTTATIKTLLQVAPAANTILRVVEWGCSFNGSAAATPGQVELLTTGTIAATVTAHASGDVMHYDADALLGPANVFASPQNFTSGTAGCGYNSSSEGAITSTIEYDVQLIAPTNQYVKQFPLGREPTISPSSILRVRTTFGTAVSGYAYVIVQA